MQNVLNIILCCDKVLNSGDLNKEVLKSTELF